MASQQPLKAKSDTPQAAYDKSFRVSENYRCSLPDPQNKSIDTIDGITVPISQAGIANFKLPLRFQRTGGDPITLETSVTNTVSVPANQKGINMSRLSRTLYNYESIAFDPATLADILKEQKTSLSAQQARIKLAFSFPMRQQSLRSNLEGWQYYPAAYEGILDHNDDYSQFIYLDFFYSSACPCAAELGEHARRTRNIYAIPHSQRSKASIKVKVVPSAKVTLEELINYCQSALKTETQVIVRREDEQAFAELNGAYVKFVEDAARLLYQELIRDKRLADFLVSCVHFESLHSHDAFAVLTKGVEGGFQV